MDLGGFSCSLAVQDIQKSRSFYEALGFHVYDGKQADGWLIMKHHETYIGLFQGMFDHNILTFQPKDVRAIQTDLEAKGIAIDTRAEGDTGPAYITLTDPDGNAIMMDQIDPDYRPNPQT